MGKDTDESTVDTAVFEDGRTSYREDGHGITPKKK